MNEIKLQSLDAQILSMSKDMCREELELAVLKRRVKDQQQVVKDYHRVLKGLYDEMAGVV